ncbi:MAG: OsmC family protein [Candidatus Omnitrophota bacterium]
MGTQEIRFIGKREFKITTRGHEIRADLPESAGGDDLAPTPSELFVASVGSCVALFVGRYMETAKLNAEGLSLKVDWEFAEDKSRISDITISIDVPNAVLGARKKAVLAAAHKCTIHNTLKQPPNINIDVEEST